MDVLLAIVAGVFMVAGLAGAVLPVVPGPPLSWVGVLMIHFTSYHQFTTTFLIITAVLMILITILDYYVPIWGTKKFGGSRAGVVGSTVGLLLGLFFFPPIGIIIGPFVGAFMGEILAHQKDVNKALKSALGSFVGFLLGTGLKLIFCGFMTYYYIKALF